MQPCYIYTKKRETPNIQSNGTHITQTRQVKHLGFHLDTQLTKSIINKIRIKRRQMYWLPSRNSKLGIENKLKIYKTIIKPTWSYGIPLWGTAATSHINKPESLQSNVLRTIVNAPWRVRHENIRQNLKKKYIRLSGKFLSSHKAIINEQQFLFYIILSN